MCFRFISLGNYALSWIVTTKCNVRTYASTTIAFPYTLLQWNTLWISIHKTSDGNSTLTCIIRPIFVSLTLVEMGKVTEHLTFLFLLIYLSDVYQFSKSVLEQWSLMLFWFIKFLTDLTLWFIHRYLHCCSVWWLLRFLNGLSFSPREFSTLSLRLKCCYLMLSCFCTSLNLMNFWKYFRGTLASFAVQANFVCLPFERRSLCSSRLKCGIELNSKEWNSFTRRIFRWWTGY